MRKKISIVLFIIIFGTICVSYIKNKTRDLEKEILKLKQEQTDLVEKLKNEKLENNYLSAPERVKKLAKIHLSQDYIEMDKTNFKYLNENGGDNNWKTIYVNGKIKCEFTFVTFFKPSETPTF